jgi:hypothetical protein
MIENARAIISFRSEWLASTGGTGSGDLDDVVQRGPDGLPALPMSSLRGVLRESAQRLADAGAGGWSQDTVRTLFGKRSSETSGEKQQDPGALLFPGDARLDFSERNAFKAAGHEVRSSLFIRLQSTAIDPKTGTAAARTLRAAETAVPMMLQGGILLDRSRVEAFGETANVVPEDWVTLLDIAAAWILALGKGKADGLGRVMVRIEHATAEAEEPPDDLKTSAFQSRRLIVGLTQTEKAAFSERSATEGAHETRLCVPGSALLGWAAREYAKYTTPDLIFHSSAVRFGDGRPVTRDGEVLWRMPGVIRAPKGVKSDDSARLDLTKVVLRELPNDSAQFEKVEAKLVTNSGRMSELRAPVALRTAMLDGRPQTGLLFGYKSLLATPDECVRYVAVIEADDAAINDADWGKLRGAFDGTDLLLGRAAGAGQGGCFRSELVNDVAVYNPPPPPKAGRVVVWALSDLALLNPHGDPDLAPGPEALDLCATGKGRLIAKESAITTRRYAPWRAHLAARDVEHCVIEAGSVLVFKIDVPSRAWPAVVGLHRELGLGRIAINPPMMRNLTRDGSETAVTPAEKPAVVWDPSTWAAAAPAGAPAANPPLFAWAQSRIVARHDYDAVVELFQSEWEPDLKSLYADDPAGAGPSRSHWRNAADAGASDMAALRRALFEGGQPVCGVEGQPTRVGDWGKSGWPARSAAPITFRQWLADKLKPDMPLRRARELLRLAAERCGAIAGRTREGVR